MGTAHPVRRESPFPDGLLPPVVPRDVSGSWRLVHWVTRSDVVDYEGLEIVFDLHLHQAQPIGSVPTPVWGRGTKIRVSGLAASPEERSVIHVEGDLSGKALRLVLRESVAGRDRIIVGEITLIVSSPWLMRGTFSTSAADSKGVSIAMREPSSVPDLDGAGFSVER